jgi:hypothetical protein
MGKSKITYIDTNVTDLYDNDEGTSGASQGGQGGAVQGDGTVVDSLTNTSTTSALSANQGKVLNDKIDEIADSNGSWTTF